MRLPLQLLIKASDHHNVLCKLIPTRELLLAQPAEAQTLLESGVVRMSPELAMMHSVP